jgi:hypothetical protein
METQSKRLVYLLLSMLVVIACAVIEVTMSHLSKALTTISLIVCTVMFCQIVWALIMLKKRFAHRSSEKFSITSSGITTDKFHPWSEFKGFIKTIWVGGQLFELVNKKAPFPYIFPPMVQVRGKMDNSQQISSLIQQFVPDITKRYFTGWKIIAIIILILGSICGFVFSKYLI